MTIASEIGDRILESILAQRLAPGGRLGEGQLAELFGCSRTIVREALFRLAAKGIVEVSPRQGWFIVEPRREDAREAFEARRVVETGLLRQAAGIDGSGLARLQDHLRRQALALGGDNPGLRSFLLGDFHVCLAQALGNALLAGMVRDLTVRTTLSAMNHQSAEDAERSFREHAGIVEALAAGDMAEAERLMAAHLGSWEDKLRLPEDGDELARLRQALAPLDQSARILRTRASLRRVSNRAP
ncbi:MAG: GntR family transcriptional regulator [Chelatococcus sp.]|nr:MAG: GntR family transcriptional regulator [Chelatococcus sp.]